LLESASMPVPIAFQCQDNLLKVLSLHMIYPLLRISLKGP
jgi:hypothetical protein